MLTETFNDNTNEQHPKRSSETIDGKGTSNLSDSNHEASDGSEINLDSGELIDVNIGGERENPGMSISVNNDYSRTDTNSNKTIFVPDETSSSSSSLEIFSNDFFQARKVTERPASESVTKDEESDVSHESSKSIAAEREKPEMSRSYNNDYLIVDTDGIKSILVPDKASSSSSLSESSSNDYVSHESSKRIGVERKNPEISRSDNGDYLKTDTNDTKSMLVPDETSSSSPSSKSSSNDFFQTGKVNFAESPASKFASKDEESYVSRQSSIKSEPGNSIPVCASTSPIYNLNRSHMIMSPTAAPPVQVMDRSSEYDSFKIPSSVFAVNTNPVDWTNDSNDSDESLFSIQLGNHSLARDHLFTAAELHKSVELTKSGELNMFSPQPSVVIEDRDTFRKSVGTEDSQTTEMSDEDLKLEESLGENKNTVKNSFPASSYNSHGNGIGVQSSALPIEKKQETLLCYCFICSWACCCFKLPSCSCLKCSSALCCCWHASPVLPEAVSHDSVKTYSPRVTSDSTSNFCNWCQCFSWLCCTSCCSHTDSPRQLSYDKASDKTSSSTCNCCSWFQCCFWSWCSWGNRSCCSRTYSPRQQSYKKDSEKHSSSTSSCCSWFHCFSGSYCSRDTCCCCCCSETDGPRHQSLDKASEETSASTSNCFQCCCSQTDSPGNQSFGKASGKTSSSSSNCCRWSLCCF